MLDVDVDGGGGWRARNVGTMTKSSIVAMGRTTKRWGSKQIKE